MKCKMKKKTAQKHTRMRFKKKNEEKNLQSSNRYQITPNLQKFYLFFSLYFCKMYLWIQIKNENETKLIPVTKVKNLNAFSSVRKKKEICVRNVSIYLFKCVQLFVIALNCNFRCLNCAFVLYPFFLVLHAISSYPSSPSIHCI